jgi:hypothetical protein
MTNVDAISVSATYKIPIKYRIQGYVKVTTRELILVLTD